MKGKPHFASGYWIQDDAIKSSVEEFVNKNDVINKLPI